MYTCFLQIKSDGVRTMGCISNINEIYLGAYTFFITLNHYNLHLIAVQSIMS